MTDCWLDNPSTSSNQLSALPAIIGNKEEEEEEEEEKEEKEEEEEEEESTLITRHFIYKNIFINSAI